MSGWDGDVYVAEDGRTFAIFSEHVRGEPRFYWAQQVLHDGDGSRTGWRSVPTAHGHDRRAVKRRVERYVRETPA